MAGLPVFPERSGVSSPFRGWRQGRGLLYARRYDALDDPYSGTSRTVCPHSGIIVDDNEFTHLHDQEAVIAMVNHAVIEDVEAAIDEMFSALSRQISGNCFISAKVESRNCPLLKLSV